MGFGSILAVFMLKTTVNIQNKLTFAICCVLLPVLRLEVVF